MNYAALLPIPKGYSFRQWADEWLRGQAELIYGAADTESAEMLRARNEKLSATLPILAIIMACIKNQIDKAASEFETNNPRPTEKGITAWKEGRDAATAEYRRFYELIERLHEDVGTRLSVAQTNLRTLITEVKHGI